VHADDVLAVEACDHTRHAGTTVAAVHAVPQVAEQRRELSRRYPVLAGP
jgi:hypothetical protein